MSFTRGLNKAQGFLMPYRRPTFGALRNTSELSLTSDTSGRDDAAAPDTARSAPGTPVIAPMDNPFFANHGSESPACTSPHSRPIAIELPNPRKLGASGYTPTESLSARGDLPGGYFPMHEDPKCRIHRPHPFHSENRQATSEVKLDMHAPREQAASTAPSWHGTHTPVSSYMPSGLYDHPLPVGKYYPSNYERRTRQLQNQRSIVSESVTSYAKTDAQGTTYKSNDDARQRLQQYQRDMVAQASMALGGSYKPSMLPGNTAALRNLPVPDARFGRPTTPQRPVSPQLQPMGSPGPVTPMDLEAQEEYITKNQVAASATLAPPVTKFAPHSL
ncbi:hypothetical protein ISF_08896 [Cordyceps fumosorosea ARSEF 2679]|uniref:Uncharacterized protein n=1 Tax=Cordyceps fumosorosea (strain ARSEF 2679) TaxID=1081104 RepID=A0A167LN11_CORFA|nr:hypothetical protein ISF_08896 [Cordyceps fumosorosea ARSEF 2679]OAA53282.1 hypothetical protein ISF_08896 [Cordyceps fumosorosea ARSEF 2679]